MIIGVPKEVKVHESRVSMVPAGVQQLARDGHHVLVEAGAGVGSGISDEAFIEAGATILPSADEVWGEAELIIKVKEPIEEEYPRLQRGQTLFTYLHLAAVPALAEVLLEREVTAIAYETIETEAGALPLLQPMSEVAGKMAVQVGAMCLEGEHGGKGLLLGGVPGVRRGRVAIIGGGTVGTNAAKVAVGMGAEVTLLDVNLRRLEYLDDMFLGRVQTLYSDPANISAAVERADLVVGAVLLPGAKAPQLVTRAHLKAMEPGSVVVDVAVDRGGCIETCHPTTHADPTYVVEGVVHYCVANMPGAVAQTSTYALTNATIPFSRAIAAQGAVPAMRADLRLEKGLNTFEGQITHAAVAEGLGLPYASAATRLAETKK